MEYHLRNSWVGSHQSHFSFTCSLSWYRHFLSHLWQVIYDLVDKPPPEPLPFPLRQLLKSNCFKALLIDCSMATVYAFVSDGWYWDFYLMLAVSHHFESTTYVMSSSCDMTSMSHTRFSNKLYNLLVLLNSPNTESGVRSILKYATDVTYTIRLEVPGTFKAIIIYQDSCTSICNIYPYITF